MGTVGKIFDLTMLEMILIYSFYVSVKGLDYPPISLPGIRAGKD